MKFFFYQIIEIDFLLEELHSLKLEDQHKHHLANIIDSSIYHIVVDESLTYLNEKDKKLFLKMVHEDPENLQILEFLKNKVDGIEDKIKKVADELFQKMHQDIKEAKKLK